LPAARDGAASSARNCSRACPAGGFTRRRPQDRVCLLRAETGEGKLAAVISHLHAVAEAVEDVIWVERRPEGSMASWLSADARDALVRQDVVGGLLNLA
jgi:exonuclease SbcC